MDLRNQLRSAVARQEADGARGGGGGGGDNDNDADDMDDYRPPTEAERKVLKARRERSDRIAKRMGEYLLKGWKMLGDVCLDCGGILMQATGSGSGGSSYCIACRELESDVSKDDPAQSAAAAAAVAREAEAAAAASSAAAAAASSTGTAPLPTVAAEHHGAGLLCDLRAAAINRLNFYRRQLLDSTEPQDTEKLLGILEKLLAFVERLQSAATHIV